MIIRWWHGYPQRQCKGRCKRLRDQDYFAGCGADVCDECVALGDAQINPFDEKDAKLVDITD